MSREDTVKYILSNNCSIARLGNGEMDIILGDRKHFQEFDPHLAKELKNLRTTNKMLLCVPCLLENKEIMSLQNNDYYKKHRKETLYFWRKYYNKNALLGDACLTRFYSDSSNRNGLQQYLELLFSIWENKNLFIIEGQYSRLGVGNDLFANAKSVARLLCPHENAYSKIDDIENFVCSNVNINSMIIVALGPTATVLSSRLSMDGYQALDLGHIDIEYEWYKNKASEKVAIKGKYVNEVIEGWSPGDEIVDKKYLSEIVGHII